MRKQIRNQSILEWIVLGLAVLSAVFGLLPVFFYGVFNSGVLVLFGVSACEFVLWCCLNSDNKTAIIFSRVLGLITLLAVIFGTILAGFMIKQAYFEKPDTNSDKVAIVLGGSIIGDKPKMMLARRLNAAIKLEHESSGKVVFVVSGGQGADEDYTEAYVMKKYLVEHGIDADDIFTEENSTNTMENIRYSKQVIDQNSLSGLPVIVTDGFHQFRAIHYANENGIDAKSVSCSTPIGLVPAFWIREFMAVISQVIL